MSGLLSDSDTVEHEHLVVLVSANSHMCINIRDEEFGFGGFETHGRLEHGGEGASRQARVSVEKVAKERDI
jgi:hypothetical protein